MKKGNKKLIILVSCFFILICLFLGAVCGYGLHEEIDKNYKEIDKQDFFNIYIQNDIITKNIFICAELFKIEPELLISLIYYESKFDPTATKSDNKNGSIDRGLMQLNNFTFMNLTLKQFYDIELNILNGSKYLKEKLDKYNYNEVKALASYNCGDSRVGSGKIPDITLEYINKILKYRYELEKDFLIYQKGVNNVQKENETVQN